MHEATRRILSVLLQRLEGFNGRSENILVCATNRKKDLDKALVSRFNVILKYDLPDSKTRAQIFRMYAKQLTNEDCVDLADQSEGLSGRGIKDVCEQVERKHASSFIGELRRKREIGEDVKYDSMRLSRTFLPQLSDYKKQLRQYQISHQGCDDDPHVRT